MAGCKETLLDFEVWPPSTKGMRDAPRFDEYGRAADMAGLPAGYWKAGSAKGMPRKPSQRWLVQQIDYAGEAPQTQDLLLDYQDMFGGAFGGAILRTALALKKDLADLRRSKHIVLTRGGRAEGIEGVDL